VLLDHLSAESIRVHCLLEDGSVRVKPLSMHPEYEMLRHDLRPGEFWLQVGDAWVAEDPRPPAPEAEVEPDTPAPPGTRKYPPSMPPLPSGMGRL
jgi:hypothetical protein